MILIFHPDGRVLRLDRADIVGVTEGARAAERPIEEGAPAIDHVEPMNISIQITATITEVPFAGDQADSVVSWYSDVSVLRGLTGPRRVLAAADFLRDCVGQFVDIILDGPRAGWGYTDCLITQWPHEFRLVQSSPFTLQFIRPRLVQIERTTIPPRRGTPADMPKQEEAGTGEAPPETAEDVAFSQRMGGYFSDLITKGAAKPEEIMKMVGVGD